MEGNRELHRRKISAGIALIAAPLVVGIAYMVGPRLSSDTAVQIAAVADAPGRTEVALLMGLAGIVLFVVAAFGLMHLLREEQSWWGLVGGAIAVTGLVIVAALQGIQAMAIEAAALDAGAATTMLDEALAGPVGVVLVAGTIAAAAGFVVMAGGLLLARTAPTWTGALLAVGAVVQWVGTTVASTPVTVVGFGVLFLALAPLGYELIAEPDEAWEHPAQFRGFRPMAGAH